MTTVRVDKRGRVTIPPEMRKPMKLLPGQKVQVFQQEGRIVIMPLETFEDLRGIARGMDTSLERDGHQ